MATQKITPFLWFNNEAQEAAKFYCSIFKNSKIIHESPMTVSFELDGQRIMGGNFGPTFKFNEAVSFFVSCDSQEEVDFFWNALTAEGKESRCGWLVDKFGLSWQIVPTALGKLMGDPNPEKAQRVAQAMFKMNKLVINELQDAYDAK